MSTLDLTLETASLLPRLILGSSGRPLPYLCLHNCWAGRWKIVLRSWDRVEETGILPSPSTPMALSGPLGTFGECDSEVDVLHWSRYNCFLLYQMGTFSAFLELLHMEIE